MGCGCCKDEASATVSPSPQPERRANGEPRRRQQHRQSSRAECEFCSRVIDISLVDGHRETCRANHRRAMAAAEAKKPSTVPAVSAECVDEADLCLICMEQPKAYALVPCGHVVGCLQCVSKLSKCPICREDRSGLLSIDVEASKAKVCKHCKHQVGPTFFDGHREVCALRMRLNRTEESPSMKPDSAPLLAEGENVGSPQGRLCGECGRGSQDTALIPCGHMFCTQCAAALKVCPMCLGDVTSTIKAYL
jgi:hypothetical protein